MKAAKLKFTQKWLSERLRYDKKTGELCWKARPRTDFDTDRRWKTWNSRCANRSATTQNVAETYPRVTIDGRKYVAHRVIWLLVTGEDPDLCIGHINGDRFDNRFSNLIKNEKGRRVRPH